MYQLSMLQRTSASAQEFERLYSAWHHDFETAGDGSDNAHWEIGKPSFRNIVEMGRPALPFLQQKLEDNNEEDGLLAFAVVEICGWNAADFTGRSVKDFRENVLRKMQASGMTPKSPERTAVGAGHSNGAVHAASRRWLLS